MQKTKSTVFLASNLGIADKARGKGGGGEGGVSLWSRVSWSFVRGDSFASQSSRGRQGLRQLLDFVPIQVSPVTRLEQDWQK